MQALALLGIQLLISLLLVAGMLGSSYLLGERHRERATAEPYESGVAVTGTARVQFAVQFYLVAMLFVVFDLEAIFFYLWAVAAVRLGWLGYGGIVCFTVLLVAGLLYEWREGALDWVARGRLQRPAERMRP